ncbi:hypothetical protein AURANDRAFT_68843, partial [Aureococcus anophagefferens]
MAVQSIYPAVEVVASRVRGATFARIGDPEAPWPPPYVVAADLGLNHACVLGPPVFLCCDLLNTIPVALSVNGGKPCAAGKAGNAVMPPDGPLGALAWLANHLLARGDHLRKGDLVMSGATCGLTKVHPGDTVVASFDTTIQMGAVATVEPRSHHAPSSVGGQTWTKVAHASGQAEFTRKCLGAGGSAAGAAAALAKRPVFLAARPGLAALLLEGDLRVLRLEHAVAGECR